MGRKYHEVQGEKQDRMEEEEQKGENDSKEHVSEEKTISSLVEDDMNEEKSVLLKKMVENMTGVLLSLKQSGDIKMAENKYFMELCNNIFEDNSDEFYEINNLLLNICAK